MALKRSPAAIVVNGAYLRVRDPSGENALFKDYVTVPGMSSWTMPAESGNVTETALMDGSVAAPQFKGVGTITGVIGALGGHPAHQFLEAASISQNDVQIEIIKEAVAVADIVLGASGESTSIVKSGALDVVAIDDSAAAAEVKQNVLWGHIIAVASGDADDADKAKAAAAPATLIAYSADASDSAGYRVVTAVEDDGKKIHFAPAYSSAVTTASGKFRNVSVRNPGKRWSNITCKVNQFDQGDFQGGGVLSSNVTFTPSTTVQAAIVEHRLSAGVAA